ncbi:LacI family DNA-binding transcriptional regulator [Telmatospirillum sp.]|uniref:LacI family DNA-binding transcriptional regulator n=1 Tax=Telmatospirillum sp. TaxID=2079197 RepID=UPI002842A241|nr:LacI family DNA-binding transcriptional regulator [Telmatospirillum sp.]MDR3436492.1 LacI family DNA-binding transcriptional regulator [Telmatospirillum sp.]
MARSASSPPGRKALRETPPSEPRTSTRSTGSVTLGDVAKLAGVSPITVSRALNHPELVTPETLETVRQAIAETGYVPNLLAGGLASSRTKLVAAIIPTLGNAMFIDTIQPLNDLLTGAGYQLLLGLSGFPTTDEQELLKGILSRRPDAIVLTGVNHSDESRQRLKAAKIPVVEMWDLTPAPIDSLVGFSHEKVGKAVADFLFHKGYRRFALVCAGDERARIRRRSFLEALGGFGLESLATVDVPTPTTVRMGREGMARLLADGHRPDAVFCSSDVLAHGVLAEAQSRGLRVPEDVAVMGFADLDFAAYTFPALSTVHVDRAAIGTRAAEILLARLGGKPAGPTMVDIGFEIIERASA